MQTEEKELKHSDLVEMYEEAKSLDKEHTAEMRNSILLIAGEQWSKRTQEFFNRSRTSAAPVSETQKLRITKNNIHRAHRLYMSSITSLAPGVAIAPKNHLELQDRKDAELNQSVWEHLKTTYKLKAHFRDSLSDFAGIGECCTVIKYDNMAGRLKGYEAATDEVGNPLLDEMGQQVPDESKPVYSGEFIFSRRFGQNIFRDPSAQQLSDAKWIGFEVLESTKALKRKYKKDPKKLKALENSSSDMVVFESNRAGYSQKKDQTVVLEVYFKPCHEYPQGYFFIYTKSGLLEQGELPGGIFPVIWKGFDEAQTKGRATGIVKIARPFQAELNRASSQVAIHQITLSDDKILYQDGSILTQGAVLPGVRGIKYNASEPKVLPGRSGEQYFGYIDRQYAEMDRALMIDKLDVEKMNNLDPYTLMFKSMNASKDFAIYAEKFGEFLIDFCEVSLELAKMYLDDDELIAATGKSEAINISEFRKTSPLRHSITVEEQSDTVETKLGRQLMLNQILQYSSGQLQREDLGKLASQMPYGNWKETFSDLTIDSRNAENDFLAIERGERPAVSPNDNSTYVLRRLASRKKERDYSLLAPEVQALYEEYEQLHLAKVEEENKAAKAAQAEFVPTSGAMIACDMYVANDDPEKAPKRVRVPYQSLEWLLKVLEQQGSSLQNMEQMNQAQLAELAQVGAQGQMAQSGQESPYGVVQ